MKAVATTLRPALDRLTAVRQVLLKVSRYFHRRPTLYAFILSALSTILFAVIPDYYTLKARVPPFEQLKRSEGVLEFILARKYGWRTYLHTAESRQVFTCSLPNESGFTCIMGKGNDGKPRSGKRGVIWWFELATYPGFTVPFAVQIEMEGKPTARTYASTLRSLQYEYSHPWQKTKFFSVVFCIFNVGFYALNKFMGAKQNGSTR